MAARAEVAVDRPVSGEEALRVPRRLEALPLALAPARWPMRILRPIVAIPALSMLDARQDLALGSSVAAQFVGDDHPRHIL
jgi:hypothetical protein